MMSRRSRRATWTIVGLALCAMYLTGTISLVGGLHETTAGIADNFQQGPVIAFAGDNFLESRIPDNLFDGVDCAKVSLADVSIAAVGQTVSVPTYAANIDDPEGIMKMPSANLTRGSALIGSSLAVRFSDLGVALYVGSLLWLTGPSGPVQVSVQAIYPSSTLVPSDWIIVSARDVRVADAGTSGNRSFAVLEEGDNEGQALLESRGLITQNSMAVINFFERGIYQIEGALWGLIGITSIIVGLLIYSTLSIEVGMRREDIRLLKKMGAGPGKIAGLFTGRGAYLALLGAAVGVATGHLAANLLISAASVRGLSTLIVPKADLFSLAVPFAIILAAGLAGALLPSIRAARESMGGAAE
jgi:hypothetical protein